MTWPATRSWPVRVLLDERLPVDLALEFAGHDVETVVGRGWAGIKNGDLLRRMSGDYDVLITMDRSIEFQQPSGAPKQLLIDADGHLLAHQGRDDTSQLAMRPYGNGSHTWIHLNTAWTWDRQGP